ncbi:YciI family protein [Nonomuraea spiralis]|uniref:YciI family protein n=1 Tax=Nonomuraea spiralis TaxID=46182 RepID=UPI003795B1DC
MGKLIVMQFVSLDGVIEDPDGSGGTPQGGWAFRHGPEAVAGDKFVLGPVLDTGLMLLGRRTWQLFSRIWPSRTDEFSQRMNAIPKLVASRSLTDAGAWANSTLLRGDLAEEVAERKRGQDVVVTGAALMADERVIAGERLQPAATATTVRMDGGGLLVTDGPFADTKEILGGFYIVEAADLDEALELAAAIPAVRMGGSVEVRPVEVR